MLAASVEAAEHSVARTPTLLEVLREAHVVDSGGQGLFRLLEGALEAARGRPVGAGVGAAAQSQRAAPPASVAGAEATAYGYETVFLLHASPGEFLDTGAIAAHLESIGDSVMVAGDDTLAKVHVHNERPDAVIAYGLSLGTLTRIAIENLDGQVHEVREAAASAFVGDDRPDHRPAATHADAVAQAVAISAAAPAGIGAVTRLPLGVVAVAPSDGLATLLTDTAAMFREYGAFRVVHGGQSANPSTGELLDAVAATCADELLILPNNPNVILAAQQVAAMTDRPVHIVPTRNCAEGVAALFELDPSLDAEANASAMTAAARAIQSIQVTEAVRDATVSGRKVKKGQTIVLDPDDGLLAVDGDAHRAVIAAIGRLGGGFDVVSVYYGADATLEDAEELGTLIREVAPGAEVEVLHGGQPHYRYLISAE